MSRPKLNDGRTGPLNVRLRAQEKADIVRLAEKNNQTVSEFVRETLIRRIRLG